ncbi:MAG: transketolase, partial [Acetobacter sp.]|nr:transketolase [Acetobacter sp.]
MATASTTDPHLSHEDGALSAQQIGVARMSHTARLLLQAENLPDPTFDLLSLMCLPVTALWCRVLRFDPTAPDWPDRDRFVVPSTTMLPLLGAMLTLTGNTAHTHT